MNAWVTGDSGITINEDEIGWLLKPKKFANIAERAEFTNGTAKGKTKGGCVSSAIFYDT